MSDRKERPILFSAPMVRAILEGRKTQTRRVVKPQPEFRDVQGMFGSWTFKGGLLYPNAKSDVLALCPYGQHGDRLWVRETFFRVPHPADCGLARESIPHSWDAACAEAGRIIYRADRGSDIAIDGMQWKPSIHMPRRASRITLEVTSVRVERLHAISEADAVDEGIQRGLDGYWNGAPHVVKGTPRAMLSPIDAFRDLWTSINGAGSWDANPWVWVVEFKRVEVAHG